MRAQSFGKRRECVSTCFCDRFVPPPGSRGRSSQPSRFVLLIGALPLRFRRSALDASLRLLHPRRWPPRARTRSSPSTGSARDCACTTTRPSSARARARAPSSRVRHTHARTSSRAAPLTPPASSLTHDNTILLISFIRPLHQSSSSTPGSRGRRASARTATASSSSHSRCAAPPCAGGRGPLVSNTTPSLQFLMARLVLHRIWTRVCAATTRDSSCSAARLTSSSRNSSPAGASIDSYESTGAERTGGGRA